MGSSGFPSVDPKSSDKGPYKRQRRRRHSEKGEEGLWRQRQRWGQRGHKDHQLPPELRGKKGFRRASRGRDFGLIVSRQWMNTFLLFLCTQFMVICCRSRRTHTHTPVQPALHQALASPSPLSTVALGREIYMYTGLTILSLFHLLSIFSV